MQENIKIPPFCWHNLSCKTCCFFFLTELLFLTFFGYYFLTTYYQTLNSNIEKKISQPAILISEQAVLISKGTDKKFISSLIQESVLETLVINPSGTILYSKNKNQEGSKFYHYLHNTEKELIELSTTDIQFVRYKDNKDGYILASMSPLTMDDHFFGYYFMRISVNSLEEKKQKTLYLYLFFSAAGLIITTLLAFSYIQKVVLSRIQLAGNTLLEIEQDQTVFVKELHTGTLDQIGLFIQHINTIITTITTHNRRHHQLYIAGEKLVATENREQLYQTATKIICDFFSVKQAEMDQLIEGELDSFYNKYPQIGTITSNEENTRFFLSLPCPDKSDEFLWIKFFINNSERNDIARNTFYVIHFSRMIQSAIRRIIAFEKIALAEERYRQLFSSAVEGIFRVAPNARFDVVNPALAEMSGYNSPTDMITTITDIKTQYWANHNDRLKLFEQMIKDDKVVDMETYFRRKDGSIFPASISSHCVKNENGGIIAYEGRIINIEERKLREKEEQNRKATEAVNRVQQKLVTKLEKNELVLQQSLKEKEVLLREIYHRTKNNMLVIISMLRLQIPKVKDSKAREIFAETENRIRAMSLVHEKLYQSDNLMEIDLSGYLVDMVTTLVDSMVVNQRVSLKTKTESIPISIDHAIPLGLAVNEIITNSIKHGFPGNNKGEIHLRLSLKDNRTIQVHISDNGKGLPESFQLETNSSFGLQITRNLILKQLNGTISMQRNNGTETIISFVEPDRLERVPLP